MEKVRRHTRNRTPLLLRSTDNEAMELSDGVFCRFSRDIVTSTHVDKAGLSMTVSMWQKLNCVKVANINRPVPHFDMQNATAISTNLFLYS